MSEKLSIVNQVNTNELLFCQLITECLIFLVYFCFLLS